MRYSYQQFVYRFQGPLRMTLRPRQNCRHFADDILKCIFLNDNVWILLKIWLKLVPKVPMSNILAMVQIMAWRRSGDKQLSEPMMVSLLTHICVTQPQWVNIINISTNWQQHTSLVFLLCMQRLTYKYEWQAEHRNYDLNKLDRMITESIYLILILQWEWWIQNVMYDKIFGLYTLILKFQLSNTQGTVQYLTYIALC